MFEDNGLAIQGNAMTPQSLELMSGPMQAQAIVQIEKVAAIGLAANTREQARSLLADTALLNAGARPNGPLAVPSCSRKGASPC